MIELLNTYSWFAWGVGLSIGFPVLALLLGEASQRLASCNPSLSGSLRQLRHVLLPSLVFLLLVENVLGYSQEGVPMRIVETLFWLAALSVSLSIFNVVFFQYAKENSWQANVPKLLLDLARFFLILVGGAIILSLVWDADLARLLTALGVGSVVIGLALQDTLGGLFAGIALLSGRQFRVGDWLKVGDIEGQIVEMNWRSVSLMTRERDLEMIPNSVISKSSFRNYSHPDRKHMERVTFDFSFDDAPHKVKQVLIAAALETPAILKEPAPQVSLITYGEFTVTHEIRFFIDEYNQLPQIRDAFISRIWYAAKRNGLTFPTRSHEVFYFDGSQTDSQPAASDLTDQLLALNVLGLSRSWLAKLSVNARLLNYGVGESVLGDGDACQTICIVLQGKVAEKLVDDTGRTRVLQCLSPGDFFGVVSLLRNSPSDTFVVVEQDLLLAELDPDIIGQVLDDNPVFAHELEQLAETRQKAIDKLTHRSHSLTRVEPADNVVVLETGKP